MLKLLALGIGFGAAFQAWKNYPADGPASGDMLAVVVCAGLLAAFFGGLWHGRGRGGAHASAVATATATATASNQLAVNFFVADQGNGARPMGVTLPSEDAPWMTGQQLPELTVDQLDGMELGELVEDESQERAL